VKTIGVSVDEVFGRRQYHCNKDMINMFLGSVPKKVIEQYKQ